MPLVATLISNPAEPALSAELADRAAHAVGASEVDWLSPNVACDIPVAAALDRDIADAALRAEITGLPVDIAIQPADDRRRSILIADMDSTMIEQECIDELAEYVGVGRKVADITDRAMNGEIEFETALRERVALLTGLDVGVVDTIIEQRLSLAPGGRELVATMNRDGAHSMLVSGGFDVFTFRVAGMLGFHEHQANRLLARDGSFTGRVAEPVLGRAAKAEALERLSAELGRTPRDAIAVGDGANDLDMILIAGTGVALHAKPAVAAASPFRIDHGDLTALLYLQGYRRSEFAT